LVGRAVEFCRPSNTPPPPRAEAVRPAITETAHLSTPAAAALNRCRQAASGKQMARGASALWTPLAVSG
jgi:hypothetical protein